MDHWVGGDSGAYMGFPKGYHFGVPRIGMILFSGLYWAYCWETTQAALPSPEDMLRCPGTGGRH